MYAKALTQLAGKYASALKEQATLEQLHATLVGAGQAAAPLATPAGLSFLLHFLAPLLLASASERAAAPRLSAADLAFALTLLLNALRPPSKLAATLLLQAPKQHHLNAFDASAAAGLQAKNSKHMKDIISQSAFLGQLLLFDFTYFYY